MMLLLSGFDRPDEILWLPLISEKQESATAQAGLSDLQALPQALVYQNFDIYMTVEFAVIAVIVADSRMGGSIAEDHHLSGRLACPKEIPK